MRWQPVIVKRHGRRSLRIIILVICVCGRVISVPPLLPCGDKYRTGKMSIIFSHPLLSAVECWGGSFLAVWSFSVSLGVNFYQLSTSGIFRRRVVWWLLRVMRGSSLVACRLSISIISTWAITITSTLWYLACIRYTLLELTRTWAVNIHPRVLNNVSHSVYSILG